MSENKRDHAHETALEADDEIPMTVELLSATALVNIAGHLAFIGEQLRELNT